MSDFTRILCPVDFSECSRHAVEHAIALAHASGATLTALYVIPPLPVLLPGQDGGMYPPIVFSPEDIEQFRQELTTFVAPPAGQAFVPVVEQGLPTQEILRHARAADLVVMGTHGRSGFERLMMGSVTERVLLNSPSPVLTVPPRAPDAVPFGPASYHRILCAIDFSPSSMKALEYGAALARTAHGRLTVFHAIEPASIFEPVMMGAAGPSSDVVARESARKLTHDAIPPAVLASTVVTESVSKGKPYREILRAAAEFQADLIVIGAHGGGRGLRAFGSTTNQVVRQATCPVLTLRA